MFVGLFNHSFTIDKLWYDIDGRISKSLKVAQKFVQYLKTLNYTIIIVGTGKKGLHIYIQLDPIKVSKNDLLTTKEILRNVSLTLILKCFGNIPEEFDTAWLGDINRLTRVPETLRPGNGNRTYCAYMPLNGFEELNSIDFVRLLKQPKQFDYPYAEMPKLTDLEIDERVKTIYKEVAPLTLPIEVKSKINAGNIALRKVIRPCLFRQITQFPEPLHEARVAATLDLQRFFTEDEIVNFYRKLNWADWDEIETRKYLKSLRKLKHNYSCKKIRGLGLPRRCCID